MQLLHPERSVAHVVLITGISADRKHFKVKDSMPDGDKFIDEIPISRLTLYHRECLVPQNHRYYRNRNWFNISRPEIQRRLNDALKEISGEQRLIDYSNYDTNWVLHDVGYAFRYKVTDKYIETYSKRNENYRRDPASSSIESTNHQTSLEKFNQKESEIKLNPEQFQQLLDTITKMQSQGQSNITNTASHNVVSNGATWNQSVTQTTNYRYYCTIL
mgnify:CR=1 FL=1